MALVLPQAINCLVVLIAVKHPVGGAWGRLQPFVLQPLGSNREGGQEQLSRRQSTFPHLWKIREGSWLICISSKVEMYGGTKK
jgi:hypothetical protein